MECIILGMHAHSIALSRALAGLHLERHHLVIVPVKTLDDIIPFKETINAPPLLLNNLVSGSDKRDQFTLTRKKSETPKDNRPFYARIHDKGGKKKKRNF